MKPSIPVWLSVQAGFVDTAGFLALQGLFTAHVTGNFVTLGAALVMGTSGVVAKLLALPVFCLVILVTRLLAYALRNAKLPVLRMMLVFQLLLLTGAALMAVTLDANSKGDDLAVILTGMLLVAGMAIQNGASRVHLATAPPTTLMTGTTTQVMLDLADLLHGVGADDRIAVKARLSKMGVGVGAFAIGCAAGALLFAQWQMGCFMVPPLLVLVPIWMSPRVDA